jgi:L-ribulose-5-phosphate 3-epimerase
MEIGVMFWAVRDDLATIKSLGVSCGQLGIGPDVQLSPAVMAEWKAALAREKFRLATVFCSYRGERYDDIPTVQSSVGFIPAATRAERERRTFEVSDFAAELGVRSIACHIGFVPDYSGHPDYIEVRRIVQRVCDYAARNHQTFALETGQEPAGDLLKFIDDAERDNLKINFDPANMILYGTGDPIEAFESLAPHVVSVHAKDGDWPPEKWSGALGKERPLGQGAVGMERFVQTMQRCGYRGTVNIEREIEDRRQRLEDIGEAVKLLNKLLAAN